MLQSNFSPEYGESGDGIVSLTMKSGTNDWHGSVYDYLRNRALDANSWSNNTQGVEKVCQYAKRLWRHRRRSGAYSSPLQWTRQEPSSSLTMRDSASEPGARHRLAFLTQTFRAATFPRSVRQDSRRGLCNDPTHQLYDPTTHVPIPGDVLTNDPEFHAEHGDDQGFWTAAADRPVPLPIT